MTKSFTPNILILGKLPHIVSRGGGHRSGWGVGESSLGLVGVRVFAIFGVKKFMDFGMT